MKRKLRKASLAIVTAVFLISACLTLFRLYEQHMSDQAYNSAQDAAKNTGIQVIEEDTAGSVPLAEEPDVEEESAPEPLEERAAFLMDIDLNKLRQTSDRILGWIHIPDSMVDYPLLMVNDNEEYLYRAWDGTKNNAGSIFLECRNQRDFSDFNTLIYGHHMKNGSMFANITKYRDADYWAEHPYVYIATDDFVRRYTVFSAYEASVTSDTYRLYFEDDTRKQSAIEYYTGSTLVESEIIPTAEDRVLTLSTCTGTGTYDTRWVIQAILDTEFARENK